MTRVDNIDWLPIELASRDVLAGSKQIILLYKPAYEDQCFLEYSTSNPDYVLQHGVEEGYTEFAILVG